MDHDYYAADDITPKRPKAMSSSGKVHDYCGPVDGTPKGPKGKSRLGGDRRPPIKARRVDGDAGTSMASNITDIIGGTPKGPKGKFRLGGDRRPPKKARRVDGGMASNVTNIIGDKSKTAAPQYWPTS